MVYNELEQGDILCCWSTLRLGTPSVRGYPLVFNFDHSQNSPDSSKTHGQCLHVRLLKTQK
jgi:hypothetical protein